MSDQPDLSSDKIFPVGWGLVYRVVCAPKSLSNQEVSDRVSAEDPPGTMVNRWEVAEPQEREDDWNNCVRKPCPDCDGREHVLMNC